MELRFTGVGGLPALAWGARVDPRRGLVQVAHGAGVETRRDGFAEAAWSGPFERFAPLEAEVLAGTAAGSDGRCVRFRPGSDRLSPVFHVAASGGVHLVSNSAVFAIALAGEAPDPLHPCYAYDLLAGWRRGLHARSIVLRLRSGACLRVQTAWTLVFDGSRVRYELPPAAPPPGDFSGYRAWLARQLRSVFENAAASERKHPFQPLVPVSRGYDSTALAVLAREAGAREAFTLVDSRRPRPERDSGLDTARRLGLACTAHDRWAYRERGDGVEVEFALFAAGEAPLAGLETGVRQRILLNGGGGDLVWSRGFAADRLAVPSSRRAAGLGQGEFRLRTGCLVFAPAMIGARHAPALRAISRSPEMLPWSLGGRYDRPIPRRIAEEAGLPRGSFATRSYGSGHAHLWDPDSFSPEGLRAYRAFVARSHAAEPSWRRLRARARLALRHGLWRTVSPRHRRRVSSSPWQRRWPFLLNVPPPRIPWPFAFTFQWAVDTLAPRYRAGVQALRERP